MALVSGWFGGSSSSSSAVPKPDQKQPKIRVPRDTDAIASIIGLAQIAVIKESNPLMTLGNGRLYPKYASEAAKQWMPRFLDAKEMPSIVQDGLFSWDRTMSGDSREELVFYNYAIPFMNKVYSTNSKDQTQNQMMKTLWNLVLEGINKLEDSYKTELKSPLIKDSTKSSGSELPPGKEVKPKKESFSLPLQDTLSKTFNLWRTTIGEYLQDQSPQISLKEIQATVIEESKKPEVVEEQTTSEKREAPKELAKGGKNGQTKQNQPKSSLVHSKQGESSKAVAIDKKEGDEVLSLSSSEDFKQEVSSKAVVDKKEGEGVLTLEDVLIQFQGQLKLFNPAQGEVKITLDHLNKIIVSTLAKGSVSEKLLPLSEKVKEVWKMSDMGDVVTKLTAIKSSSSIDDNLYMLSQLNKILDGNAVKYSLLVNAELDEVITF